MHHKLRQVMLERNQGKPLDDRIEMDAAYLAVRRRCRDHARTARLTA